MADPAALPTPDELPRLRVIRYPDPRLRKKSAAVRDDEFGPDLAAFARRLLELMREEQGVGLAAPQVGVNRRVFVMNATGEPGDDRVYVNPILSRPDGESCDEEGCLSLPEIKVQIWRSLALRLEARDATGGRVDETAEGFVPRIWQHETDHLDGVLITDKMSATEKIAHRKKLKELEKQHAGAKAT